MAHSPLRCLACSLLLLASCASNRTPDQVDSVLPQTTEDQKSPFPPISLAQEASTLGESVRHIGETVGGGMVVMNGIHEMAVPPLEWRHKPFALAARELAEVTNNLLDEQPEYLFIYPPGYEILADLHLADQLPRNLRDPRISLSLGNGTALYNALSLLSYHLGTTIIAANKVAEARCGELVLTNASPGAALEAIFRSARIPSSAIRIEATDDYVFVEAADAPAKGPFLLGGDTSDVDSAVLAQPVNAVIPLPPDESEGFYFYPEAIPLSDALATLGAQVGLQITAETRLNDVLVNPCSFRNITLGTALDLLLRQWPVAGFGYEVRNNTVLLRAR